MLIVSQALCCPLQKHVRISLIAGSDPMNSVLLLFPFYGFENWGLAKWRNLPEATQLVNGIYVQIVPELELLTSKPVVFRHVVPRPTASSSLGPCLNAESQASPHTYQIRNSGVGPADLRPKNPSRGSHWTLRFGNHASSRVFYLVKAPRPRHLIHVQIWKGRRRAKKASRQTSSKRIFQRII